MKNILSRSNRGVLEEFLWSKTLLAFDYDGTLAPIVTDPEQATMRPETRALLEKVAGLYRVIVISGREQADVLRKLRGVSVCEVLGNHGIEPWHRANRYVLEVRRWLPRLERCLAPFKGVTIENKLFSVSVHYRRSRERRKARAAILLAALELGEVRIIPGKLVMNILPKGAPHKGVVLERERQRLQCDTAIFVGDDETDEDVFALDQPGRLLGIRVGAKRTSAASYYIPSQHAVDDLLRILATSRLESRRGKLAVQ
jgi:trehalose 6-phosphate phosphatase